MDNENACLIYPVTKKEQHEIRRELGLKDSTIEEDIDAIVEWFYKQPHLAEAGIERCFIERMLIVAKGSIERTKSRIDNWYKYRLLAPEIIQGRERVLSESKDLWNSYLQVVMPKLYKGHRITVIKFTDPNPSNLSLETFARNTFMLADIRMRTDYFSGDIWVLDMKILTLAHVLRLNPTMLQKIANIFHRGLGLRVQSIHILNAGNILHHFLTLMKQYFTPKLMDRISIHQKLDDLHMNLPKRYLPKDYGGEERAMEKFKDMYENELRSTKTRQILINSMKMISNEKLRPNADINEDYLSGSFRKLDFD